MYVSKRRPAPGSNEAGLDPTMQGSVYTPHGKRKASAGRTRALSVLLTLLISLIVFYPRLAAFLRGEPAASEAGALASAAAASSALQGPTLVSYSYFEKDTVQVRVGQAREAGRCLHWRSCRNRRRRSTHHGTLCSTLVTSAAHAPLALVPP